VGLFIAGPVLLNEQTLALAFLAGFGIDSAANKA
jgi:hypothetical protein